MARFAYILLVGAVYGGVVSAFRPSALSPANVVGSDVLMHPPVCRTSSTKSKHDGNDIIRLSLSNSDGDADLASLDSDLSREIEEALSLAQTALTAEVESEYSPDEEDIDEIANMLLEKPPPEPQPIPLPPKEEPPESVITLSLEESAPEAEEDDITKQPSPPESPPTEAAVSFAEELAMKAAEALQKKAAEEMEKLKNSIFGVENELERTEAKIEKEKETSVVLKQEIEDSIKNREDMMKRIEQEFV